jgi:hypothetical protein
MKKGFKVSPSGQLGRGVYLAKEDKAQRFAQDAQKRNKGHGAIVLKCEVKKFSSHSFSNFQISFQKCKYVQHSNEAGNWRKEGYDMVEVQSTNLSSGMECCVADPKKVSVIAWRFVDEKNWIGNVSFTL